MYAGASLGPSLIKNNYAALMTLRALQSLGGPPIPAIAYGIVDDVIIAKRGKMLGPMLSTCNGLSAVGPVAAGAAAFSTGAYIWIFVTFLVLSGISLLLTGFTVPETSRVIVGNGSSPTTDIWRPWRLYLAPENHPKSKPVETSSGGATERPNWEPLKALSSLRIIAYGWWPRHTRPTTHSKWLYPPSLTKSTHTTSSTSDLPSCLDSQD